MSAYLSRADLFSIIGLWRRCAISGSGSLAPSFAQAKTVAAERPVEINDSNRQALDLPVVLLSDDERTSANPSLRATTWQGALKQRCRVSRFETSMTRS
jgi:hypothetical protein